MLVERLKKAVLIGFFFLLLLSLLPVLSLKLLDREADPVGSLVSESVQILRESWFFAEK